MINSPLEVHGSIWYFSGLTFIGCLFAIACIKETRGLTDIEKKTLYSPKNTIVTTEMEDLQPETVTNK